MNKISGTGRSSINAPNHVENVEGIKLLPQIPIASFLILLLTHHRTLTDVISSHAFNYQLVTIFLAMLPLWYRCQALSSRYRN